MSNDMSFLSTHRYSIANNIGTLTGEPGQDGQGAVRGQYGTYTKNALLRTLTGLTPDDPDFAYFSQRLTEVRENLRALQKLLEQENQFAMEQMKSMEKTNEGVFR